MNHTKAVEPTKQKVGNRIHFFCPIADCPDPKATQKGYAARRSYEHHFQLFHVQSETVGFISRLDFGSPGARFGLQKRTVVDCGRENVPFVVFAAGLVSYPHLKDQYTNDALDRLWEKTHGHKYNKSGKDKSGKDKPPKSVRVEAARDMLLSKTADDLARFVPRFKKRNGRLVRIYLVTSEAPNYDGPIGRRLAQLLVRRRTDIRYEGEGSARIPLPRQNKVIEVLVPRKASWRSKYFSTAPDRMIEDQLNETSDPLPDLWVVGCTASSLQRPQGEMKRPYITVPALHKLQEVHTAENQVGIRFVEFTPGSSVFQVRTNNYKDLTAREREFIPVPKQANEIQKQVVTIIKAKGPHTIGMFEDALRIPRSKISEEIVALNKSSYRPKIKFDVDSQKYDFDPDWIQRRLVYPSLPTRNVQEDKILAFGCLHAGSTFSEYKFFFNQLPMMILRYGYTTLVGAGDFIQGLEHDLDRSGEVMPGFNNYTRQEMLAARLVCNVMVKVFEARLDEALQATKSGKLSGHQLEKAVNASLLTFLWNTGNHDDWVLRRGHISLATFSRDLVSCLTQGLWGVLDKRKLSVPNMHLRGIAEEHVRYGEVQQLPSGLGITIIHPRMSRALTSSLRAQHTLKTTNTPVVVEFNFHVAIFVEQWESDIGQRIVIQGGANVWKTMYEHGQLKGRLDVGVSGSRILSQNGKIFMTETMFYGEGTERKEYGVDGLIDNFLQSLNSPD